MPRPGRESDAARGDSHDAGCATPSPPIGHSFATNGTWPSHQVKVCRYGRPLAQSILGGTRMARRNQSPSGPQWGQWGPPPQPRPASPSGRPGWARKRVVIPAAFGVFIIGVAIGGAGSGGGTEATASAKPAPAPTVTATATETAAAHPSPAATVTVEATPKPAPTVTRTKTVRVTVAPRPAAAGTGGGSSTSGGGSTYYANCTAVRAAGAAPLHAGDPGYGRHLDRDGDGVACE